MFSCGVSEKSKGQQLLIRLEFFSLPDWNVFTDSYNENESSTLSN